MVIAKQVYFNFLPLRTLILPLYIPCLFFAVGIGASIFIFPLFAFELSGNVALSGLVLGLKGAGTLLMNLPSGLLVSRFGEKYILIAAASLLIITGAIASQINSITALLICSFLVGIAVSLWFLARLKYVSDHIPQQLWGRAMATLSCIEKIGMLLGPLVAGYLITFFHHGFAFNLTSLMALAALCLICLFTDNRFTAQPAHPKGNAHLIFNIVKEHRRLFLTVGSVIVIMLILRTAKQALLPIWGLFINLDAAQIGFIVFLVGCADLLMFLPAGLILDHWGRKWSALPSLLIFAVGYAALPLADDYSLFIIAAIIIGLGDGLSTGWGNTLISDLSPAQNRGEFFAVWRTIGDAGTLSGPLVVGYLAATIALPLTALLTALAGVFGAILLASKVKETRQKQVIQQP